MNSLRPSYSQQAVDVLSVQGMRRRTLVRVAALGLFVPLPTAAQLPTKVHRVGILHGQSKGNMNVAAFRSGMHDLGYREGNNLKLEYRWAEGKPERLVELAGELTKLKVDMIFTATTTGALAAKKASTTIPIIFVAVGDPVGAGVVSNLAHPGGNITGFSHISVQLAGKTLELLKEAVPRLTRVIVIAPSENPTTGLKLRGIEDASRALGVALHVVEVRRASDFELAFSEIRRTGADALIALTDTLTAKYRRDIIDFASKNRLPAIYEARDYVDSGGLMSYGTNFREMYRAAAVYGDKILKGDKPGELPVQQPTKFELVVNLRTARALELTLPPSLVQRADQIVQ